MPNGPATIPLTVEHVKQARAVFVDGEPRNLFYLVATELIDLARNGTTKNVSVAQALAVLLQTWNAQFYRFRGGFHEGDLLNIEALLQNHSAPLRAYQSRQISSFAPAEKNEVSILFASFAKNLGPVGASKCLHLLAPNFFPLWDDKIANAYKVNRDPEGYFQFMCKTKAQCVTLEQNGAIWPDLLKAIDECNYCAYTLKSRRKARRKSK